jgi:adenosylcobinamide-GDP ribazoletransferase
VRRDVTPEDLGRSVAWFPFVGTLIGALLAAADALAHWAIGPPASDALLVLFLAAATGALHLDGLIDTADGLAAGPDVDARLAAMRQGVTGIPGAIVGCTTVIGLYVAFGALPPGLRTTALVLAPLCGRTAILVAYCLYPYGRSEPSLSRSLKQGATPARMAAGLAMAAAIAAGLAGVGGLALVVLSLLVMATVARLALRRLSGLTGDVHGAICEMSQMVALLAAPVALRP